MKTPSKKDLDAAYRAVADIHKRHLAQHGVKLPPQSSYKWIWLAMLHYHKGGSVHKDAISDAVQKHYPEAGRDQQVRHLKRDGWNVIGGGGFHALEDPYRPSPEFINEQARRHGRLSSVDFDDIKKSFGNRCATCGSVEGEPDPRYGEARVHLQQGHQDPDEPGDDLNNIIPQCQFCNRAYRRDFVFDDKGRANAVADIGPVKRARTAVQKKIWKYLGELFGNTPSDKR